MSNGLFRLQWQGKKRRWGLSYTVWYWIFNKKPHDQLILPYTALSPITKKRKDFITEDDIWEEIELVATKDDYSVGQQLFYLLPIFANPIYVINDEYFNLINEYHYVTDYNIPLGKTLDETSADKLTMFNIIKNEMGLALKNKADKKNGR